MTTTFLRFTDEAAVQAFARRFLDPRFEQELVVLPKA